jgi:hypothetical protein
VAKAEHLERQQSRSVVTSLPQYQLPASVVYETIYGRGEMENRIKEQEMVVCGPYQHRIVAR